MIKKISHINLAVFKNFVWKDEILIENQKKKLKFFDKINIMYGRNYSGKTTLSRIFRAMETGNLSDRYEKPSFTVSFEGGTEVTQDTFRKQKHEKTIRVFNEDFVRENLKFITNSDDNIAPFTVLGEKNIQIEKEIEDIKNRIGSDEEGKETGLYAQYKKARDKFYKSKSDFNRDNKALDELLHDKATRGNDNIKDNKEYGNPRFTIIKLKEHLDKFIIKKPLLLTENQRSAYIETLKEEGLSRLAISSALSLEFQSLADNAKNIVTQDIGKSDKIYELLDDPNVNRWVDEGRKLHETNPSLCFFCGNEIASERWVALKKHFDEKSDELKSEIDDLIPKINARKISVSLIDERKVYSVFRQNLNLVDKELKLLIKEYNDSLDSLVRQINDRKNNLFIPAAFECPKDVSQNLAQVWKNYWNICHNSNEYTETLASKKEKIREELLLNDLYKFSLSINYKEKKDGISQLETIMEDNNNAIKTIQEEIQKEKKLIQIKERSLSDERRGAEKINEYLSRVFDSSSFAINAKSDYTEGENSDRIFFEVTRDGKRAHHLSQGEQNLLAFCYFMAKLEDVETTGSNPIIWIDDPISSLDGNHIFFVYSLIDSEIISKKRYEQIFVSTHSLEFLKCLSRLGDRRDNNHAYFLVERQNQSSTICTMPEYIKKFFTEFNYLFRVIYKCAYPENFNETSLSYFYSFGNNARRFLEIYLYYKYPRPNLILDERIKLFFEDGNSAKHVNRLINEYSHSKILEGGISPNENEIQTVARIIIDKLKKSDMKQFIELCKSVGITCSN